MRLIDADKLYPDSIGRKGLAISQSQIAEAPTVEYTFEEAFQKTVCGQKLYCPKRPTGEWIEFKGGYYKCDKCGGVERAKENFCSRCGADMRGGEEE